MSDDKNFIGQCEREYPEHNAIITVSMTYNPMNQAVNITAKGECGFLGIQKTEYGTISEDNSFEDVMSSIENRIFNQFELARLMKSKLSAWAGEEPEFEDAYGEQKNIDIDTMNEGE